MARRTIKKRNASIKATELMERKKKNVARAEKAFKVKAGTIPEGYKITAKVETITPEKAQEYLDASIGNRPISASNLKRLTTAMVDGRFYLLPDPLVISSTGETLNAHHRLHAAVNTGTTIQLLVVRGLPKEIFPFLDTNCKVRNQSDALAIARGSEQSFNRLQSTLQMLYDYSCSVNASRNKITNEEMIALDELYPNAEFWTERFCSTKNPLSLGAACAAASIIENAGTEREKVTDFFDGVQTGAGLESSSPGLALRNRLIDLRTGVDRSKRGDGAKHRGVTTQQARIEVMRLVISCWNKHAQGKQVKSLQSPITNIEPRVIKKAKEEK